MKKIVIAAAAAALAAAFLFSGCGKSEEVKNVQELIAGIGEVGEDSSEKIEEAKKAYDALSDEDKEKVNNYDKLEKAEEQQSVITGANDDIAAIVDAADTTFTKNGTDISGLIDRASEIKETYDGLSDEQKALIGDVDKIDSAVEKLTGYVDNANKAAVAYVKAFNKINAGKKYEITGVYCIKQIRNETDEFHFFALTYKDGEEEHDVFANARCTQDVSADAIADRAENFFADAPLTDDNNAKENGNIEINLELVLAEAGK